MIIFQLSPCRIYPKIISKIHDQFPSYRFVHEVCEFKNSDATWGSVELENNPLELTPNNYQFERCDFICGIFSKNKINKQEGDFWFTITLPKEKILQEFFAATKYFGSTKFVFLNKHHPKEKRAYQMHRKLSNLSYDQFECCVKNKKINSIINDKIYNIREDIIPNGDFDYVGSFDDWAKTIKDIKKLIGLDLFSLKNEKLYSYKN